MLCRAGVWGCSEPPPEHPLSVPGSRRSDGQCRRDGERTKDAAATSSLLLPINAPRATLSSPWSPGVAPGGLRGRDNPSQLLGERRHREGRCAGITAVTPPAAAEGGSVPGKPRPAHARGRVMGFSSPHRELKGRGSGSRAWDPLNPIPPVTRGPGAGGASVSSSPSNVLQNKGARRKPQEQGRMEGQAEMLLGRGKEGCWCRSDPAHAVIPSAWEWMCWVGSLLPTSGASDPNTVLPEG